MPVQLTKKTIDALKTLRSLVRFRAQFHESDESIEIRNEAKTKRQPQPPQQGMYVNHAEVLDEVTQVPYVDVVGLEGESEADLAERAVAEALRKGRPASPSELAGASELVAENARLKAELETLRATKPKRGRPPKVAAGSDDDE